MGSGRIHLDMAMPLLMAASIGFLTVLCLPLLRIELEGRHADGGLMTSVSGFLRYGMSPMALFAFVCVVFAPLGRIASLLFAIVCVRTGRHPPYLARGLSPCGNAAARGACWTSSWSGR